MKKKLVRFGFLGLVFLLVNIVSFGASATRPRSSAIGPASAGKPCSTDADCKDSTVGKGAMCYYPPQDSSNPRVLKSGACRQFETPEIDKIAKEDNPGSVSAAWSEAFDHCQKLDKKLAKSQPGWRLPTVPELESLCHGSVSAKPDSPVPPKGCPDAVKNLGNAYVADRFWASSCYDATLDTVIFGTTTKSCNGNEAFVVDFNFGGVGGIVSLTDGNASFRCVRTLP